MNISSLPSEVVKGYVVPALAPEDQARLARCGHYWRHCVNDGEHYFNILEKTKKRKLNEKELEGENLSLKVHQLLSPRNSPREFITTSQALLKLGMTSSTVTYIQRKGNAYINSAPSSAVKIKIAFFLGDLNFKAGALKESRAIFGKIAGCQHATIMEKAKGKYKEARVIFHDSSFSFKPVVKLLRKINQPESVTHAAQSLLIDICLFSRAEAVSARKAFFYASQMLLSPDIKPVRKMEAELNQVWLLEQFGTALPYAKKEVADQLSLTKAILRSPLSIPSVLRSRALCLRAMLYLKDQDYDKLGTIFNQLVEVAKAKDLHICERLRNGFYQACIRAKLPLPTLSPEQAFAYLLSFNYQYKYLATEEQQFTLTIAQVELALRFNCTSLSHDKAYSTLKDLHAFHPTHIYDVIVLRAETYLYRKDSIFEKETLLAALEGLLKKPQYSAWQRKKAQTLQAQLQHCVKKEPTPTHSTDQ